MAEMLYQWRAMTDDELMEKYQNSSYRLSEVRGQQMMIEDPHATKDAALRVGKAVMAIIAANAQQGETVRDAVIRTLGYEDGEPECPDCLGMVVLATLANVLSDQRSYPGKPESEEGKP